MQLYSNATATLAANITAVETSLTVMPGQGVLFTSPTAGNYERATLHSSNALEIIYITGRIGDVLTVSRAQEGSTAQAWLSGDDLFGYVTIREQIISKFADRAAALSTLPVLRCQRALIDTDDRFVTVWDGPSTTTEKNYRKLKRQMQIVIECFKKTINHSVEANAIMGEIETLMTGSNATFDGLAMINDVTGIDPKYPDVNTDYTTITVRLKQNIVYRSDQVQMNWKPLE